MLDNAAGDAQRSGIGRDGAADDLDERGFSGAVLSDQGVDFSGEEIERDAFQRAHPGVRLGDVAGFEKRV
jgi:hypothetical protein